MTMKHPIKVIRNIVLLILGIMTTISMTSALSLMLWCNADLYPCPPDSTIFMTLTIDKSTYGTNEPMRLYAMVGSDDHPDPSTGLHLNVRGQAVDWSTNIFPDDYTAQDLRDGMFGNASLGNAPSTPGSYFVHGYGSSGHYGPKDGTISYDVVTPSIDVHFGE